MIRIERCPAPAILHERGEAAKDRLCDAYDRGTRTFTDKDFDASIYAAATVKAALRETQRRKCAFCESIFDHIGYGDVEHFRPKAGYKQHEADDLRRPGYYWLAYAWSNLFYSCQLCNQRFKRNLFPLKDGRRRARSHRSNLDAEEPLLVDPAARDPVRYVGFRGEYAYAVEGCREGEVTIEVLGLNREELVEVRRRHLKVLKWLVRLRDRLYKEVAADPSPKRSEELRELEDALQASRAAAGEYAAMVRAFLDHATPVRADG